MEDQELMTLKSLKAKLLKKACNLIEKLKMQEADDQRLVTLKIQSTTKSNFNNSQKELFEQCKHKLCEITRQVSVIKFENIDRKWLSGCLYQYTTRLVTTALECLVELTVKLEKEKEFEIHEIKCYFINVNKCYILEIQSWVQNICRMKNFSLLTSAISQYNEQSILRTQILEQLKVKQYVSCRDCTDENGGISVYLHSPENVQQIYLILQWSLMFIERTWQIEHVFVIHSTETGIEFTQENQDLLQNFCKLGLEKQSLIDLWTRLCSATDLYEEKNVTTINENTE